MTTQSYIKQVVVLIFFSILHHNTILAQTISVNSLGSTPICSGDNIGVSFTINTTSGTFNSGNTFFVEMSDATGSFASPTIIGTRIGTSAGPASSTIPVLTAPGTYKVRIRSNDPYVMSSNTRDIIINNPAGNPAVFGDGFWKVYVYKDNNFSNYGGFFQTGAALNIDSKDYFATNGSPDDATGYSGCVIPNDNHSYIFKRKNFPCGYYIIDIPRHDDNCELIIDGVSVYSYASTGGPRTAVWAGILGPDSDVEFKIREFTGNSEGAITFTPQSIPIAVSPSVSKCASATATLTVNSPVTLNYSWSPATGLSSTTGASVTTNTTTNTTYTVTATEPNSGCIFTETIDVSIIGTTPVVNILPANPNSCPGSPIMLTATGATNYTWYQGATVLGTGAFLTVSPTSTTTYTVVGDDGCTPTPNVSAPANVTVTVGSTTIDPTIFGNNEWRAYVYRSSGTTNHLELLLGMYVEPNLSFDTQNRWNPGSRPSLASGYIGCEAPIDNFTLVFKRTNFTCGMYQIDISQDEWYWLYIDGALVSSNNTAAGTTLNTWRGVLTPNSTVELIHRERWGQAYVSINITPIEPIELPTVDLRDPSICGGAVTLQSNIKNYDSNIYTNTTYAWTDGTNTWNTPDITVAPLVNTTYNLTITKDGCTFNDAITVNIVNDPPVVVVSPVNPQICAGQSILLTASGALTYTWKDAGGNVIGTGNSITVNPAITTTYTVSGNDGCQTVDETVTVSVGGGIDPNTFGANKWLAFCYDGNNFNRYYGVYEENSLSFDTRTVWVSGINGTPSSAPGYVGCAIPVNQHSVKYKRKGFPCGYYRLDLPYHDDAVWVYIDGVQVYHKNTWFENIVVNNIWTGFLGPNSEVEFRWTENSSGSGGALTLTDISAGAGFVSADVTICEGSNTTLTANLAGYPSAVFNWSADPTYITLSNTTGSSITATAVDLGGANNGVRTVTCTITDPTTGCSLVNTVDITVDPLANTQVTAPNITLCIGESVTLTATGANTYSWSASPSATAGMSATTGNSITVTPTETTTYTVSGSNNCNIKDVNITINVLKATIAPSSFGSGEWNVFVYSGNLITSPATAVFIGNYTEKSISFDSRNRWTTLSNPSTALALPDGSQGYAGCPAPNDNHSVSYKRTNFSCGFYQISVSNHDDSYQLYVNGALVSSSTGCCQTHLNVWSGLLDATSTVEFIWQEGTGNSHGGLSIGFALSSPTTLIWTGGAGNTDWFNPLNWCPGSTAPTNSTDVIIPGAGVPTQPIINNIGAVCKNIEIGTGALLTLDGSRELEVYGDWVNNGNFAANNGTVHLRGSTNTQIRGSSVTNFHILDMDKPSQTITLGNGVTIIQALSLNNVELALNRNTLTLNNPNPNTITRTGNAFINGETNDATNLSKICWNIGTNIDTYVYPFGVSFTEYIPVTFDKKVNSNVSVCIATRGTAADNLPFTTGTNMNSVYGGSAATVIDRWWDISVTGGILPLPGADITFSYRGSENTLPTPTDNVAVQHYSFSNNDWDLPLPTAVPGVTSGIGTVTAINVKNFSPFVIGLEAKPLPVSMLYFEAKAQEKEVVLDWATASEQNNDYFEIQRSQNGKDFETITQVKAQTTASPSGKRFYQVNDKQPHLGTSYYRLKQVDKNGEFSYTNIVAVTFEEEKPYLLVSPNPTDNEDINVILFAEKNAIISLEIIDNKGVTVYTKNIKTDSAGYYTEKLNLPQIPAGLYTLYARGEQTLFFRMIVQ